MTQYKETPFKPCEYCGEPLTRRKFSNGKLETPTALVRRKYCSQACQSKDAYKSMVGDSHKICAQCKETLHISNYRTQLRKEQKPGLHYICRSCETQNNPARYVAYKDKQLSRYHKNKFIASDRILDEKGHIAGKHTNCIKCGAPIISRGFRVVKKYCPLCHDKAYRKQNCKYKMAVTLNVTAKDIPDELVDAQMLITKMKLAIRTIKE